MQRFDQRINLIRAELARFLSRYTAPLKMDAEARDANFMGIVEAINRRIEAGASDEVVAGILGRTFGAVADRHETNAWPLQSEFVKAMRGSYPEKPGKPAEIEFDPVKINAARIRRGDPVADTWLWGREALRLIEAGIGEDVLDQYRTSAGYWARQTLGMDHGNAWVANMEARHRKAVELWGQK